MKEAEGGGEKREKATPRRLREARKQGQVASSRDLSRTATSLVWLILLLAAPPFFQGGLSGLTELALQMTARPNATGLVAFAWHAGKILLSLSILPIACVAIVGMIVTRLQVGAVFSVEPIKPKLANLNPASGAKRVFSLSNFFEGAKGLIKSTLIVGLVTAVLIWHMDSILQLSAQTPRVYGQAEHWLLLIVFGFSTGLLLLVSVGDWLFQRFNYQRSMRMSKQEVRRERQSYEGDPNLRSQRRRLQRRWASSDARQATRQATALVVNPTHIAVALFYEPESTSVPLVTATGEGQLAALMRLEAQSGGVPIMRSIPLARRLYFLCEDDDEVPEVLFDAVAEVLAWADKVRGESAADGQAELYREAHRELDRLAEAP